MFFDAFGGVLVASRMYVSTSALLSCYERVFITKKIAYFMISEFWTFGLQNLFVRTPEPFFSNLRTFGLKNLRTRKPSNLRTFGLIGCNPALHIILAWVPVMWLDRFHRGLSGTTFAPYHFPLRGPYGFCKLHWNCSLK